VIELVIAATLALSADDPPVIPPPLQPQPQPVIREYSGGIVPVVVTTVDTVCDHGNRLYRWIANQSLLGGPATPGYLAVVPNDPTCKDNKK
jgi:hypothetical protein